MIIAPIGLSIAASMDVDPRPFLVAITFAASTSFATPIGYQTNTMIHAPGGYRFLDYTRVGGPLNLIFWGLAVFLHTNSVAFLRNLGFNKMKFLALFLYIYVFHPHSQK